MPVGGGGGEKEEGEEAEEEADDERMAWRRSFQRACALLGRGGDKAVMMPWSRRWLCLCVCGV